jgi:hypothetical protein
MSQLSRELRENPNAQKALGGFKTISELVEAFMSRTESAEPEDGGRDAFEKRLEEAAEAKREPPAWLDARAVKETTEKLVGEFGPEAAAYYKKALGHKDLGAVLAEAGLKSHPEIGRALVLLGREMSEDSTVPGRRAGSGHEPVTLAEGARLY